MKMARAIFGRGTDVMGRNRGAGSMRRSGGSANGNGHHQPAVGDERIASSLQAQGRLRADVTVPYFAVVADRLDRLVGVVVRDAELGTEVAGRAEQPLHVRVLRIALLVDIRLRNAQLFRGNERIEREADQRLPARLA